MQIYRNYLIYKRFNTQPPKGGWLGGGLKIGCTGGFNTQPPKGGWFINQRLTINLHCFNTQPPKGGWAGGVADGNVPHVSTRSRLKAAGNMAKIKRTVDYRFNTQPPKGGWIALRDWRNAANKFQHAAA